MGDAARSCTNQGKDSRFLARLISDLDFRRKLVRTGILCWSLVGSGFALGMSGPAFLDITEIIKEDITKATFMFTIANLGYLSGSLGGGIVFDRCNKLVLLIFQTLGLALSHGLTPFCTSLTPLLVVRFFVGLFAGAVDTGTQADIFYIWGTEGSPYMLALHFTYSVGVFIAPLVTEPFLAERTYVCPHVNSTSGIESYYNKTSSNAGMVFEKCEDSVESTRIHLAFIITASICLSSTICFFVLYIAYRKQVADDHSKSDINISLDNCEKEEREINQPSSANGNSLPVKNKVLLIVFVCLQLSVCALVEDNFGNFLMTFTTVQLRWRKSDGSFATAVSRMALTITRFITIFMTKCCRNSVMLFSMLVALILGILGFYVAVLFSYTPGVWIFAAVIGAAMSSIYPTVINWTTENVMDVKGWVLSILVTTVCVFSLIFPTIFGHLIENVDPMWFIYLLIIFQAYALINYGVLILLRRRFDSLLDKVADESDEVKDVFLDKKV